MSNADTEEGAYKEGIVIDAENADVVINVTGDTTFDKKDGNKDDCANFITVRRANSVTVNAEGRPSRRQRGPRLQPLLLCRKQLHGHRSASRRQL